MSIKQTIHSRLKFPKGIIVICVNAEKNIKRSIVSFILSRVRVIARVRDGSAEGKENADFL